VKPTSVGVYQAIVEVIKDNQSIAKVGTAEDGSYNITIPAGVYTLKISKQGYETKTINIVVVSNATTFVTTLLKEEFCEIIEPQEEKQIVSFVLPGEIKIFGGKSKQGIVNPEKGENVKIVFRLKMPGKVSLKVFTLLGELVYEDAIETNSDNGMFTWLPKDVATGTYIVYVKGPGVDTYKKIVIAR